MRSSFWTTEQLFSDSDEYFAAILHAIAQAKREIRMEMYIFEQDEVGKAFVQALKEAAQRGVQVYLLLDAIGSWFRPSLENLRASGVKTRIYHPNLGQLNRRTHRKICLIDRKQAFIGSQNISANHSRRLKKAEAWIDLAVKVTGRGLRLLAASLEEVWNQGGKRRIYTLKLKRKLKLWAMRQTGFRLNTSRILRRYRHLERLTELRLSEKRIWVAMAYFVPDRSILAALAYSAKRGVDVRILVSRKSDIFLMPWMACAFFKGLIHSGVRVYEYAPHIVHAKVTLADGRLVVGSSNWNHRSLLHDLEIEVLLDAKPTLQQAEQWFNELFARSHEVTQEALGSFSWWQRLLGRIALYFKYWF